MRDCPERQIAASGSLSDGLLVKIRIRTKFVAQLLEPSVGVRWTMSDPEARARGLDAQPELWLVRIVLKCRDVLPVNAVVADDGRRIASDGAAVGSIVVFPRKVDDVEREGLRGSSIYPEVVPIRLTIAAILV